MQKSAWRRLLCDGKMQERPFRTVSLSDLPMSLAYADELLSCREACALSASTSIFQRRR